MKVWASAKAFRSEVADVPENWLVRFAAQRPEMTRKLGDARNSTMLFNVNAALLALENGELNRKTKGSTNEELS